MNKIYKLTNSIRSFERFQPKERKTKPKKWFRKEFD